MTCEQYKKLKPNTKLYSYFIEDDKAFEVIVVKDLDENSVSVRKKGNGDGSLVELDIEDLFIDKIECERNFLQQQEEFNCYTDAFRDIRSYLTHLLLCSMIGHEMSQPELSAAVNRASDILGTDAWDLVEQYANSLQ